MTLNDVGYNERIDRIIAGQDADGLQIGRVISEQKERYIVVTESGELEAEITGNMRFSAQGREDFPAVGDWVFLSVCDTGFGIITRILPRCSVIKRRAAGRSDEAQIIATNIDYALIVQAADANFNLNRIDRYLAICSDSGIQSMIVITKIDLFPESKIAEIAAALQNRIPGVPAILLSNETEIGLDLLRNKILKGTTWCMLGSSGVGKSSLLNKLSKKDVMKTGEISSSTSKGRHTTSYRELVVLESGGILIDNPGMREVGLTDDASASGTVFDTIRALASHCRFADCTHTHEAGCAVLGALESGELDRDVYNSFIKLEKEKQFFAMSRADHRKKDKDFGKMVKNYKREKNLHKF